MAAPAPRPYNRGMDRRPLLLLLIGNTSLRWRCVRGGQFAEGGAAPVADPPPDALRARARGTDAYAASVNPPGLARLRAALGAPIPAVGADIPIPIENRTREPARVGADRLLAALGAWLRAGASIVVDAGTAITVDLVAPGPAFEGGAILPGPARCAAALHGAAALLPPVTIDRPPASALGRDTEEAIRAGVYFGAAGAIRFLIENLRAGRGELPVLVTGGGAELLLPALPAGCILDGDLAFRGMAAALDAARPPP